MSTNQPQSMQRLWLVRHGATQWNSEQRLCGHSDIALSSLGRSQARWLSRHLRSRHIAAIYSSDLARAWQTAEIIAQHHAHSVEVKRDSAWREIYFGDWEGCTYDEIASHPAHKQSFFTDPARHTPPNGEMFSAFVPRVQAAFAALIQEVAHSSRAAGQGDIVLVSHGGVLRILLCHILGMPFERQWQLRIDQGSLSAIDFWVDDNNSLSGTTLALLNCHRASYPPEPEHTVALAETPGLAPNG